MKIFPRSITEQIWRQHLSDYSRTLVAYVPHLLKVLPLEQQQNLPVGVYLCPLCLNKYFKVTKLGIVGNSEFSLDHLPPQSSGGTYTMITCKKCNNDSGTFESELEKTLNFGIDKQNPSASPTFKVEVSQPGSTKRIQGVATFKDGVGEIIFDENRKKYNKSYIDLLAGIHSKENKHLQLSVPLFDAKKIERSLLKSAYLLCFYWWGYEFAFSENGAFIRDVIAGKKTFPCQVPLKWDETRPGSKTGISLLQFGEKRMAYIASIVLKGIEVTTTANILIPLPTSEGLQNLAQIDEVNKAKVRTEITMITLPRLLVWNGYTISWLQIFRKPELPQK